MANDRDGQPIVAGTDYVPIGPALAESGDKTLVSIGGQPTVVETARLRRVAGFASAADVNSINLQLDIINTAIESKQPLDALLTALAALTTVADRLIYCTGADTVALATLTAAARTLLAAVDAAGQRAAIGAAPTAHTHTIGDVTDLESEIDAINFALSGKAATSHTHAAGDITSGTLAAARLPALTGAVTSSAGSASTSFGAFKANSILMNMTNASGVPTAVDGVDAAANMWAFLGGSYLLPAWDLANAKLGSIAI